VYDPVMKLFGQERLHDDIPVLPTPRYTPMLDFKAAVVTARELAQREATQQGLSLQSHGRPGLYYRSDVGAYVWGWPYRIVVSAIGLMVTLLAATGALIWLKKRKARELAHAKRRRAPAENIRPIEPQAQPVTLLGNHSSLS
jgi:hypothetical protein